jgi:hypothetical protein
MEFNRHLFKRESYTALPQHKLNSKSNFTNAPSINKEKLFQLIKQHVRRKSKLTSTLSWLKAHWDDGVMRNKEMHTKGAHTHAHAPTQADMHARLTHTFHVQKFLRLHLLSCQQPLSPRYEMKMLSGCTTLFNLLGQDKLVWLSW